MRHIHPINEDTCREHFGKPVLVILRDGSEMVGVLSAYENGQIILNRQAAAADPAVGSSSSKRSGSNSIKSRKTRIKAKTRAKLSAFPGPGPGFGIPPFGGGIALDLSLIALLFLLV